MKESGKKHMIGGKESCGHGKFFPKQKIKKSSATPMRGATRSDRTAPKKNY